MVRQLDRHGGPGQVICHGDFGPWNIVWVGTTPVGLLDFEYARPGDPLDDVAYACEYFVPFRDDAECLRWLHYPKPPDRRRRISIFAEAYGSTQRTDWPTGSLPSKAVCAIWWHDWPKRASHGKSIWSLPAISTSCKRESTGHRSTGI